MVNASAILVSQTKVRQRPVRKRVKRKLGGGESRLLDNRRLVSEADGKKRQRAENAHICPYLSGKRHLLFPSFTFEKNTAFAKVSQCGKSAGLPCVIGDRAPSSEIEMFVEKMPL
jgi:hypothetical protein